MTESEIYEETMSRIKRFADSYLKDNIEKYMDSEPDWRDVMQDLDTTLFLQFEPRLMQRYGTDTEAVWAGMFVMCLEAVKSDLQAYYEDARNDYYEWNEFHTNPNKYYGVKSR